MKKTLIGLVSLLVALVVLMMGVVGCAGGSSTGAEVVAGTEAVL